MQEKDKRIMTGYSPWRLIYPLFSGILFLAMGIVIFVRAGGFRNFFSAGLFALLIAAYGIYRIFMFINLLNKRREGMK